MLAVALDGPAGAGKSTVARRVARELGFLYIDTGAMYRAVAYLAVRAGVELADADALGRLARAARFRFEDEGSRLFVDDADVSEAIRRPDVTALTRFAAQAQPVRAALVERQRAMATDQGVVMEGRDIGTRVFPDARWKLFLDASVATRAERRAADFAKAGHPVDRVQLEKEIADRDASDYAIGPLKEARDRALAGDGFVYLDTTGLTVDEVVARVVTAVKG